MKTYLDCYSCFVRQALEASRMAGADTEQQRSILLRVFRILEELDPESTPPEIADSVHRIIRQEIHGGDPYRAAKDAATAQALALCPRLRELMDDADDPLDMAIRLSIAGNIIDFAPSIKFDLWDTVQRVCTQPYAANDQQSFRKQLEHVNRILFLADNAGETVFDRFLIELIDTPVLYAVKGGPVLNDATVEDAVAAGVDRVAAIVSTGSDAPGTIIDHCSQEFRQLYDNAEMIIAKGQANYETLSKEGSRVFFLLQIKCPIIAQDIGFPTGSIVLRQGRNEH